MKYWRYFNFNKLFHISYNVSFLDNYSERVLEILIHDIKNIFQ